MLYIAEVDQNGQMVEGTEAFAYQISYSDKTVTLGDNMQNASVTITNQEKEQVTPTEIPEETPVVTGSVNSTTVPQNYGNSSNGVKTGDNTPIARFVLVFVATVAVIAASVYALRKRRK